jgi:hypothetical protein
MSQSTSVILPTKLQRRLELAQAWKYLVFISTEIEDIYFIIRFEVGASNDIHNFTLIQILKKSVNIDFIYTTKSNNFKFSL